MRKSIKKRFTPKDIVKIVRQREKFRLDKLEFEKQDNFKLKEEYKQCMNYLQILDWILND